MLYVGNINTCDSWKIAIKFLQNYDMPTIADYSQYPVTKELFVSVNKEELL